MKRRKKRQKKKKLKEGNKNALKKSRTARTQLKGPRKRKKSKPDWKERRMESLSPQKLRNQML